MRHYSSYFCNIKNNLNCSENSEQKMKKLLLIFGLMLTKTKFLSQLGYIVMSDSKKNQNVIFLKKKYSRFFWSRKVKKTVKIILFASTGTCKKRIS